MIVQKFWTESEQETQGWEIEDLMPWAKYTNIVHSVVRSTYDPGMKELRALSQLSRLNSPETKTTMSQYSGGGGLGVNTKVKELKNRAKRVHVLFEHWHKVIESL